MTKIKNENYIPTPPTYAIHGDKRRELMKERNALRSFIKSYDRITSVNNDLYAIYEPKRVTTKEQDVEVIRKAQVDLDELNLRLSKPYESL